jgi:hypothetical protein
MAGLVPAIHAFLKNSKTWMPGIKPGMTEERECAPQDDGDVFPRILGCNRMPDRQTGEYLSAHFLKGDRGMLKMIAGLGVALLLAAIPLSYMALKNGCLLQDSRNYKNTESAESGKDRTPPRREQTNPTATFDLSISEPGKINGSYYAEREKDDWAHKFWCDAKIGEFALVSFTLFLVVFTGGLWFSTDRLWKAGKEALEVTERALVFLDGFDVELTTALNSNSVIERDDLPDLYATDPGLFITRFAIFPRWKNSGSTPTKRMTVQVSWRGPVGPIPPDYLYKDAPQPFFLAPGSVEAGSIVEMTGVSAKIDWSFTPLGVEPPFFIWGRAEYEDVFGRSHFVEWCRQLRLERHDGKELRAHFIQWGDYNRTDNG